MRSLSHQARTKTPLYDQDDPVHRSWDGTGWQRAMRHSKDICIAGSAINLCPSEPAQGTLEASRVSPEAGTSRQPYKRRPGACGTNRNAVCATLAFNQFALLQVSACKTYDKISAMRRMLSCPGLQSTNTKIMSPTSACVQYNVSLPCSFAASCAPSAPSAGAAVSR